MNHEYKPEYNLSEHHIYGSSRLGLQNYEIYKVPLNYYRRVGDKRYELSNHLGNVLSVVSDRKIVPKNIKLIHFDTFNEDLHWGLLNENGKVSINKDRALQVGIDSLSLSGATLKLKFEENQAVMFNFKTERLENFPTTIPINLEIRNVSDKSIVWTSIISTDGTSSGSFTSTITADYFVTISANNTTESLIEFTVDDFYAYILPASNTDFVSLYLPDVLAYNDYYPFGMQVPNRFASIEDYRYGFQGQEKDDEVKGEGNSLNYTFRMHDPRVGRFFAVDPLTKKYPYYSPYSFSGNKVIRYVELEGLEEGSPDHFDGWTNVGDKSSPAIQDVSNEEMNRRNSAFISVVTAPIMLLKPVQFCVTAYAMGDLNLAIDKSEDARQAELSGDFQKAQTLKNEVGDLSKSAIFEAVGSGIGYSLSKISVGLKGAKFAQNGNHSEVFSDSGQMIYSELVGYKITTIDDLANAIKNCDVLVENVPVQYVARNGENVILNTRTSAALNRAGIPMDEWHGVDVTGVAHPVYKGETFDYAAEKQINKNYKPGEELSSIPPK